MSYPFLPTFWDKLLLLPTWLLYRAFRFRLPADHPWKEPIDLAAWTYSSKPLNYQSGFILWSMIIFWTMWAWVLVWGDQ